MLWLLVIVALHGSVTVTILTGFSDQKPCEEFRKELPVGKYSSKCIPVDKSIRSKIDW